MKVQRIIESTVAKRLHEFPLLSCYFPLFRLAKIQEEILLSGPRNGVFEPCMQVECSPYINDSQEPTGKNVFQLQNCLAGYTRVRGLASGNSFSVQ